MHRGVADAVAIGTLVVGMLFAALAVGDPIDTRPRFGTGTPLDDVRISDLAGSAGVRPELGDTTAGNAPLLPDAGAPTQDPNEIASALVAARIEGRRDATGGAENERRAGARTRRPPNPENLLTVPEPGTAVQLGLGLVLLAVAGRRRS